MGKELTNLLFAITIALGLATGVGCVKAMSEPCGGKELRQSLYALGGATLVAGLLTGYCQRRDYEGK